MEIKFKIETLGYMIAEFSGEKKTKIGHSSCYGDKFQELLNEFFWVYQIVITNKKEYLPYSFDILWEDDFCNYRWEVNIDSIDSLIKIKIYEQSPSNLEYKIELINEAIKFNDLFHCIYISLEELFVDFGFIGYKINWEVGNFPIYEYMTLKACNEKMLLKCFKDLGDENWKQKITIDNELKIINY